MRNNIAFKTTDGTTLRGWHYLPAGSGRYPTIVMAHGFSAVKEMYLDKYAEAFMQAGFASIVYDNRNLGASDGEPGRNSIPGCRSGTILMPSHSPGALSKLMLSASAFGGPATAVGTCWSWPRSTGECGASCRRFR